MRRFSGKFRRSSVSDQYGCNPRLKGSESLHKISRMQRNFRESGADFPDKRKQLHIRSKKRFPGIEHRSPGHVIRERLFEQLNYY